MKLLTTLLIILALPALADDRLTVCTATINSSDEAQSFKKNLDPRDFKFVELTDYASDKNDPKSKWFDKACQSDVVCDVLLVSGHFSGEFFSDYSALKLSLNQMEQKSCQKSCDNILKRPQEVFLMGCNTLSEKNVDSRSPTEYYNVLRKDGFTPIRAQEIVESRYGELGDSNKARMDRVFSETAHLYGFSSVVARGKYNAINLNKYFQTKGDYASYLRRQSLAKNSQLAAAFKNTSYREEQPIKMKSNQWGEICGLRDDTSPNHVKIESMVTMLSGEKHMLYLPSIVEVIKSVEFTQRDLAPLRENTEIHQKIMPVVAKMKNSVLGVSYMEFAYKVGWISKKEFLSSSQSYIQSLFTLPLTVEKKDRLCTLPDELLKSIRLEDIKNYLSFLKNAEGAGILSCLNLGVLPQVSPIAITQLRSTQDEKLQKQLIWMLQDLSDKALYAGKAINPQHVRSEDERILNEVIMKIFNRDRSNSSLLYSFVPGTNLNATEKSFIRNILLRGSSVFQGWEYARMVRVAAASGIKDSVVRAVIQKEKSNSKVESAAADYFSLIP